MLIFLLNGQDPNDRENPENTWIVVAKSADDARKLLPGVLAVPSKKE